AMDTDAIPRKPTFKQDWPSYGRAQKIEKRRVQELLRDLTSRLPERERDPKRRGPKPHLVRDAIFAMALKVYCGLSSRRTHTDLETAFEKGYASKQIPGAKVTAFFEDDYFTPVLKDLITFSASPLRPLEKRLAIDGSLENFEEIAACGTQGYIAFKSNTTGGVGGHFEKAFHLFLANREEYLAHYHLRSNAESTFSAVKRKFGPSVMSLTETAMVNE